MAPSTTIKILVVGPKEAGKSAIANFLAEQTDRLGGQERYQPTMGVRILEIEKSKCNVELWDVSGDQIYEACWPAITKDVNGAILVYNPDSHVHESEVMLWYEWFIQSPNLDAAQCLIFEHSSHTNNSGNSSNKKVGSKIRLPPQFRVIPTTYDTPNVFKSEFDKLVHTVQDLTVRQSRNRK